MIDGAKALSSAIREVFGALAAIQRCQIHKRRNILGHLRDRMHANVTSVLKDAWDTGDAELARPARWRRRPVSRLSPDARIQQ